MNLTAFPRKSFTLHLVLRSLRFFSTTGPPLNRLPAIQHNASLDQSQNTLFRSTGQYVQNPAVIQRCDGDHTVKRRLDRASDSKAIVQIMEQHHPHIQHAALYGKAMQKCNVLRNWHSVQLIMRMMLSNPNVAPQCTEFHVFMNSMARSNVPSAMEIVISCFHSMITTHRLIPDRITFGILLKCLTKRCKYHEAVQCWNLMTHRFGLEPDVVLFTQMITVCSRARQSIAAKSYFDEYLNEIRRGALPPNISVFNAYFNVCAEDGDLDEMRCALRTLRTFSGLFIDHFSIIAVMKCCLNASKYTKCLRVLDKWLEDGQRDCTESMMHIKCYSLCQLIRSAEGGAKRKHKLYSRLKHTIYAELKQFGLAITPIFGKTHLEAAISVFGEEGWSETVAVFEGLMEQQLIGYLVFDGNVGKMVIDLHGLRLVEAQFVLRYLFRHRLDEVARSCDGDGNVYMVVGRGKHSPGMDHEKGRLRQFVIEELASWSTPIAATVSPYNRGVVLIQKSEMIRWKRILF